MTDFQLPQTTPTAKRTREDDLAFQVALEAQVFELDASVSIAADACRKLAVHLGASASGYGEASAGGGPLRLLGKWRVHPVEDVTMLDGDLPAALLEQSLRIIDVKTSTPGAPELHLIAGNIAGKGLLSVPLPPHKDVARAFIFAVSCTPRAWNAADTQLLTAVGLIICRGLRRVRANAVLRSHLHRLNGALSAATALGTWDWNIATGLVQADEAFARLFALDPQRAALGAPIDEFIAAIHPQDRGRVEREIKIAVDSGDSFESEYRLLYRDGTVRWVLARGRASRNERGVPVRFPGALIDISARKQSTGHQQVLDELALRWQELDDPTQVAYVATEMLGAFFEVSRAGYGLVDMTNETITIERDWNAPGVSSIAGVLKFREHGSYIDDLKRGETVIVTNADTDPRTAPTAAVLKAIDAHSFINMPVVERGGFVALLFLNNRYPRTFSADDIALLREVGARTHIREERLRVAQALKDSEAQFRAVAEAMPGFLWAADSRGGLTYTSPSWHEYSGDDGHGATGRGWVDYVHPEDRGQALKRWLHSVNVGVLYETEFRLRRRDGVYRSWLVRAVPVRGKSDTPERWIGSATDIDAIAQAREALTQSRDELERQVEERTVERDRAWHLSANLLAVLDASGIIVLVNTAWSRVLGWHAQDLEGRSLHDFIAAANAADDPAPAPPLVDFAAQPLELRMRHKDGGERIIDWTGTLERDRWYASGRDITHEREQEAALAQVENTLRQAQKMEAVGQLTGGIAHDFNNMLSVIVGSLDLLRRRVDSADVRTRRYVSNAMDGAKRAAVLTQRLLAFSRQQPLEPEAIDANALVSGMSDLLRHSLGIDIHIETVLAGGLWTLTADRNQLENVLVNLAVNARDAMPSGGRLTIETQNAHLDDRYVASELGVTSGHYVLVAVTDTGSGMPPDVIAKAFDPFFTTKEVGKGTGLGLSQVYGFVKQSRGHVKIYSEIGIGTTVKIYLPRLAAMTAETAPDSLPAELPRGDSQETILVVEDEAAVRQITADALVELGYRVLEADGAAAALRLIDSHPEIKLMFTDIVMPNVNGAQLAATARQRRADLKVLFTTGYTRNAVVHNGVLDVGVELLGKPFTLDELASKIRTTLDGER